MMKNISIFILILVINNSVLSPLAVRGLESPPEAPSAPAAPTSPPVESAPVAPTAPPINTTTEDINPTETPSPTQPQTNNNSEENNISPTSSPPQTTDPNPTPSSEGNPEIQIGQSQIDSGDSNVSGTAVSAVNTNLDNIGITSQAINGQTDGNIILGLNGANTNNSSSKETNTTENLGQSNLANIGNTLTLSANSGDNNASYNTGNNATIVTGDANVSANSLTFANNNIQGKVIYQVVDIYGELRGDIVLPEEIYSQIEGNGSESHNTSNTSSNINNDISQSNTAVIDNDISTNTNTGENVTAYNTDGDSTIVSGNSSTQIKTLNVANNNIGPGDWWIVIINKAGEWVGELVGGRNSNLEAETEGDTTTLANNGAQSENHAAFDTNVTTNTQQQNDANIGNKLNLSANTGRNSASYNTAGDTTIKTGDAKIIANVSNFVNNNIAKGGKLVVTVVNVFGKWLGNFVPPGQTSKPVLTTANPTAVPQNNSQLPPPTGQTVTVIPNNNNQTQQNFPNSGQPHAQTPQSNQRVVSGISRTMRLPSPTVENLPEQASPIASENITTQPENMTPKKALNVNLAWLLFGLPVAAIAWLKQLLH